MFNWSTFNTLGFNDYYNVPGTARHVVLPIIGIERPAPALTINRPRPALDMPAAAPAAQLASIDADAPLDADGPYDAGFTYTSKLAKSPGVSTIKPIAGAAHAVSIPN